MNQQLEKISDTIKTKVLNLYNIYSIKFDNDKYIRVIDMVTRAMISDSDIPMVRKLQLYYSALLYPTNNIFFHRYDHGHARDILNEIIFPTIIGNRENFIEEVVDLIAIMTKPKINPENDPWKYIIKDAILIDRISPPYLVQDAIRLRQNGIPLYTRYTVQIKEKSNMKSICNKSEKYRSFMEYIYHVKLHEQGPIISRNQYLIGVIDSYHDKIIDLCLIFGEEGCIIFDDLRKWARIDTKNQC